MGGIPGASRETSSPEGTPPVRMVGTLRSGGTGAVQDGQAGKKTRCGRCAPPATARRCGQAPKCRIASAQPGTETGSRQAGVCGTARTGSGHPGSPAGPSAATSQSRQTPARRHIRARNKKVWVSVCLEMEFNGGARAKEALSPQGRHQRPAKFVSFQARKNNFYKRKMFCGLL